MGWGWDVLDGERELGNGAAAETEGVETLLEVEEESD